MEEFLPTSLLMESDRKEAITVNFSDEKTATAMYSKNETIVEETRRVIVSQIYLYRFWRFFGTERIKALLTDEDRKLLEKIDRHLEGKK
jgi:hypothetical protein